MRTIDELQATGDTQRAAGRALAEATEQLARVANGVREGVMPAPVAYDLLGAVRTAAVQLREVVEFLPRGLAASLQELRVYDQPGCDPQHQVDAATVDLGTVANALSVVVTAADAAQAALSGQGYDPDAQHVIPVE